MQELQIQRISKTQGILIPGMSRYTDVCLIKTQHTERSDTQMCVKIKCRNELTFISTIKPSFAKAKEDKKTLKWKLQLADITGNC
jgi:hypothetical protein